MTNSQENEVLKQKIVELENENKRLRSIEDALARQKNFLDRIINQSPFATWVSDANGTLQLANPALKKFLNLTDEQLVGKYNVLKDPLVEKQGLMPLVRSVYEEGESVQFACDWDGNDIPALDLKGSSSVSIEATMFPVFNSENKLINVVLNWIDVTERKKAQEALQESELRFRRTFEHVAVGICHTDISGSFLRVNERFCGVVGYTEADLLGKKCLDITHPDDIQEDLEKAKALLKDEIQSFTLEKRFIAKDYSNVWVSVTVSLLRWPTGEPRYFISAVEDISSRKKMENQLRHHQKMEAIGTLAAGIAHDFNNILASILGFTELSIDEADKGSLLEDNLVEIQIAGRRAKDLVKQILLFSKQADDEYVPLRVDIVANSILKFISSTIPPNITIRKSIRSTSHIMGNDDQVRQLIVHLCNNAVGAMAENGGILGVSVEEVLLPETATFYETNLNPGRYIQIKVSDTGEGIRPEIMESIFEPYFTTKDVDEGSGMGLAVAHGIAEGCKGKITAESSLGEGSLFTVYLPISTEHVIEKNTEPESLLRGNEHVLFLDDELQITKLGRQLLERLGYSVTACNNSLEALTLFRKNPQGYDLVITDLSMPGMSGEELTIKIKQVRPDIPVILCTGYTEKITEDNAKKLGINAFMYKPIKKEEFACIVRSTLDGPGKALFV